MSSTGQTAQQVQRLLAGDEHPGEIIKRCLRVGAAQAFVKGGNQVVVALAVLVVDGHAAVEQLGQFGRAERLVELHGEQRLDLVEEEAAVAVRACDQRLARFMGQRQRAVEQRLAAAHQFLQRLMVEAAQDQHLAARQQSRVELEARVLGGGADERDRAVLDVWQEAVLLGAVEAVDLVDEKQCLLAGAGGGAGLGEDLLEVSDSRKHCRYGNEAHSDCIGEKPGDAGLAGAGRSPQDHRGELAGDDHSPDGAIRAGQMLLADDLVEAARPQPVGKRRPLLCGLGRRRGGCVLCEQVGHRRP